MIRVIGGHMSKFIYRIPNFGELIRYEILTITKNEAVLKAPTGRILVIGKNDFDQYTPNIEDAVKRAIANNANFLKVAEQRVLSLRKKLCDLRRLHDSFHIKPTKKAKA